ncbi:sugar ABC transporter ATP-binding protein [Yersinia frederiksenii]|uniref:sugar ABC transporter ATP-binding protein n=1 Tax=Yersinia frederiksenii TaxID=29484 RepID=UPI0011AAE249|nr:sugar ABC transporter ATP-binding protein [Yersinia frederiksenii]
MTYSAYSGTHAVGGLEMNHIRKSFPGTVALDGATLRIQPGEAHGLIGENGAGKSTLIKILAGVYHADSGEIIVDNKRLNPVTATTVHASGIRFIHQELHLIPHFTVTESVFMGQELRHRWLGLDKHAMRQKTEQFFRQILNTEIDGNTLISALSIAERKLVQIARALIDGQARLVVFDEPTAPLEASEAQRVFAAISELKSRGIAIIYISHYLSEITALCDRVTVFRNGKEVDTLSAVTQQDIPQLIRLMIGRDLEALFAPRQPKTALKPRLEVNQLRLNRAFSPLSFQIAEGEIVGIAGLLGSGRDALIDTLYGLQRPSGGSITINGQSASILSPAQAIAQGIVLVPRDRRHQGLVLEMPVTDNINLASLSKVAWAGWEQRGKALARAKALANRLRIRPNNLRQPVRFLSGGNQQKVILARWLATDANLFILDEPTLGVDMGARAEIYQLVESLVSSGKSALVSSSDASELIGLCDRILVMLRGELVAEVSTQNLTLEVLLALTTGSTQLPPQPAEWEARI